MLVWEENGTAPTVSVAGRVKEELQLFTENRRLPENGSWSNW